MGGVIERDPGRFQDEVYDLVVIGGGICGVAATLAAARAGRRVLLVEREDFGGATSWNNLRVLGGGLPYTTTLNLPRIRRFIEGRAWFVSELPDLVEPLTCLMPLYDRGFRRGVILGPALSLYDAMRRHWSSPNALEMLPESALLSRDEVLERFRWVRRTGLSGGALWFDGLLVQPQRVLVELLRRAVDRGAVALNYMEVTEGEIRDGRMAAVRARDTLEWNEYEFRTSAVLNCAGPWAAALVARHDPEVARRYHPLLAFNLLLDHPLESDVAVAVEPPGDGPTYLLNPRGEKTLAGTRHLPWREGKNEPSSEEVDRCLADLRAAVPDFHVTGEHVLRVMSGLVLARHPHTVELARRPIVRAARDADGPEGLYTLVGSQYTTAPLAAEAVVAEIFDEHRPATRTTEEPPPVREVPDWTAFGLWADRDPEAAGTLLDAIVREESVIEPDDLLLRRTDWGLDPQERNRTDARIRQLRPRLFNRGE